MKIPLFDPTPETEELWDELNAAMQQVLKHGQFILGPEVKEFEESIAEYLGVEHAVGVNSGTDALVIALRASGVGEGDEVITTPFSFFATAESISNVGAKPVFVDIEYESMNIDPGKISQAVTDRTKAILPVHLFGNPCNMEAILDISENYDLSIIEDCAQSFGAACTLDGKSRKTGSMGDLGAYSFFPTKNLGGAGDGGLITTNDDQLAHEARRLRAHGSLKKYHNEILGYNSRLDTLQAAILQVKLKHIDESNTHRRTIAKQYSNELSEVEEIRIPAVEDGHVFHQYTIKVPGGRRDSLRDFLKGRGIGSNIYYPIPQDQLPVYRDDYPENGNPVSNTVASEVLSLPMGPHMDPQKARTVNDQIQKYFSDR